MDCVFLGTSIVDRGLSPADFEQAYQAAAGADHLLQLWRGRRRRVYRRAAGGVCNARVSASPARVRRIARLGNGWDEGSLAWLPWLKYQQGEFSPRGWLAEHSRLYGYSRPLVNDLTGTLSGERRAFLDRMILANGFYPTDERITFPMLPGDEGRLERSNYAISEAWLSRLDDMLAFHRPPQTHVVIVEMPVHPVALEGRDDRLGDYAASMSAITERAGAKGVLFSKPTAWTRWPLMRTGRTSTT